VFKLGFQGEEGRKRGERGRIAGPGCRSSLERKSAVPSVRRRRKLSVLKGGFKKDVEGGLQEEMGMMVKGW
jgi:hypothetical protein